MIYLAVACTVCEIFTFKIIKNDDLSGAVTCQ